MSPRSDTISPMPIPEEEDEERQQREREEAIRRAAELSPALFRPLFSACGGADGAPGARAEVLEQLLQKFGDSLEGDRSLVMAHAGTVARLAAGTPCPDVTDAFAGLAKRVEACRAAVLPRQRPPSHFIPSAALPAATNAALFGSQFARTGRVSHIDRVLAMHPEYYEQHSRTTDTFLRCDGPLPFDQRCYVAILASAQCSCQYLVGTLENEFRLHGGDEAWLRGVEFAHPKLRALLPFIATLAHRPWRIGPADVEALVKNAAWSIGEIVSAIALACTFIALAGVAFGTGVNPEIDLDDRSSAPPSPCDSDTEDMDARMSEQATATLAEKLRIVQQEQEQEREGKGKGKEQEQDGATSEAAAAAASEHVSQSPVSPYKPPPFSIAELEKYRAAGLPTETEEFDVHSREYTKFPVQEFNWTEHGYELVSRFFSEAASLLDELFTLTYNMTYHTFSNAADISTDKFRQAIWYYVQLIHGVLHEDYDYHSVNEFLNIRLKRYVKMVVRHPQAISKSDFSHMGISLRPDEKVHVCLLATESYKQVVILYGLHAVMAYMTR